MCVRGKNKILQSKNEKNMILEEMKMLRTQFKKAQLDYENKQFATSFLAVKSFTFGMAEIMDKETIRFKQKLKIFQKSFKKKINKLENKLGPNTKYVSQKVFTNRSRYGFKPVTPNPNLRDTRKRSFGDFKNSQLDSLFKKKVPSLVGASPKLFSPYPNLPFFDLKNGSNMNSFNSKSKNMISMPEIKTPFSVHLGILQESLEKQEKPSKAESSLFVKESPLNFEQNEVEIPKGIKRVPSNKKNSSCFVIKDRKQWSTKKAIFCWDNKANLEIITSELVHHLSNLFGNIISPQELIVRSIKIKAFTKSTTQPNLLAVKLEVSERYKSLVEESWKEGSPSHYFKFKIDLLKQNYIRYWNEITNSDTDLSVKNLFKSPARYNYSQANHYYKSEILNKETVNLRMFRKLKKD